MLVYKVQDESSSLAHQYGLVRYWQTTFKFTYYNSIEWHIIPSKNLVHQDYING